MIPNDDKMHNVKNNENICCHKFSHEEMAL